MSARDALVDQAGALLVLRHQSEAAQSQTVRVDQALGAVMGGLELDDLRLDGLLARARQAAGAGGEEGGSISGDVVAFEAIELRAAVAAPLELLDFVDVSSGASDEAVVAALAGYVGRNAIDLPADPFAHLLTPTQRIALEERIRDEFQQQPANCDKVDYLIAATCGLIGGLVDVLFVGTPMTGQLTKAADGVTDSAAQMFARFNGWKGPGEGKDPTSSAIGFLERKFPVNYDQAHSGDVDGAFKMSPKNHHLKSLGHSPDLVGLFFSILDQFNSTAHFVSEGKLISIDTKTFELKGGTVPAKIFAGFCNWLGHLFSDAAGSSGATGRGSGVPIPFYSLLQFIDVGEFGQHRQTFATIAVRVFENGYDARHGMAMAIPVLLSECLTRVMWVVRQRFQLGRPWSDCVPSANVPEVRRMLLVAHGTLCLVDTADASLRCGGDIIQFLLRSNLVAYARLGTLALKELRVWHGRDVIDAEAVDEFLDGEYRRMLACPS